MAKGYAWLQSLTWAGPKTYVEVRQGLVDLLGRERMGPSFVKKVALSGGDYVVDDDMNIVPLQATALTEAPAEAPTEAPTGTAQVPTAIDIAAAGPTKSEVVTTPTGRKVAAQVPTKAQDPAPGTAAMDSIICIDTQVVSGPVGIPFMQWAKVPLEEALDAAVRMGLEGADTREWSLIEFGKGRGLVAMAIRQYIKDGNLEGWVVVVDSSLPLAPTFLEALYTSGVQPTIVFKG